jgi:hypothetical protein
VQRFVKTSILVVVNGNLGKIAKIFTKARIGNYSQIDLRIKLSVNKKATVETRTNFTFLRGLHDQPSIFCLVI